MAKAEMLHPLQLQLVAPAAPVNGRHKVCEQLLFVASFTFSNTCQPATSAISACRTGTVFYSPLSDITRAKQSAGGNSSRFLRHVNQPVLCSCPAATPAAVCRGWWWWSQWASSSLLFSSSREKSTIIAQSDWSFPPAAAFPHCLETFSYLHFNVSHKWSTCCREQHRWNVMFPAAMHFVCGHHESHRDE